MSADAGVPPVSAPVPPRADRVDFAIGACLALPIVFPVQPILPFAIAAYLLLLPRMRPTWGQAAAVLALFCVGLLSSVLSPDASAISIPRALYTSLGYTFFLAGTGVRDRMSLGRGYTLVTRTFAVLTVVAFIATGAYHYGVRLFQEGPAREWGSSFFPAWPNYFAFFLGIGLLMEAFWWRRYAWAALTGAAIFCTTSRTGLLAVLLLLAIATQRALRDPRLRWPTLAAVTAVGTVIIVKVGIVVQFLATHPDLARRLARASDRLAIYRFAWPLIEAHPWIGLGHVILNQDFGAPSSNFHNSYLEVLVRHGVLGLALFLFIVWPRARWPRSHAQWAFVLYYAVATSFNDILRNPHSTLLYAALILGWEGTARRAEDGVA